jgi:hypothetical protein
MIKKSDVMGEHPSLLSACASTRVYVRKAADDWIFLRSYLDFSYVHTDSFIVSTILQSVRWWIVTIVRR